MFRIALYSVGENHWACWVCFQMSLLSTCLCYGPEEHLVEVGTLVHFIITNDSCFFTINRDKISNGLLHTFKIWIIVLKITLAVISVFLATSPPTQMTTEAVCFNTTCKLARLTHHHGVFRPNPKGVFMQQTHTNMPVNFSVELKNFNSCEFLPRKICATCMYASWKFSTQAKNLQLYSRKYAVWKFPPRTNLRPLASLHWLCVQLQVVTGCCTKALQSPSHS